MKHLNFSGIEADALTEADRRWRIFDSRGQHLVIRMPDAGTNIDSSNDGEAMQFWRFDSKSAAQRFRSRCVLAELSKLTGAAGA